MIRHRFLRYDHGRCTPQQIARMDPKETVSPSSGAFGLNHILRDLSVGIAGIYDFSGEYEPDDNFARKVVRDEAMIEAKHDYHALGRSMVTDYGLVDFDKPEEIDDLILLPLYETPFGAAARKILERGYCCKLDFENKTAAIDFEATETHYLTTLCRTRKLYQKELDEVEKIFKENLAETETIRTIVFSAILFGTKKVEKDWYGKTSVLYEIDANDPLPFSVPEHMIRNRLV